MESLPVETIGGKKYRHIHYTDENPGMGQRDLFFLRLGITGQTYTGRVYLRNIMLGSEEINLSDYQEGDLSSSYGSGFSEAKLGKFGGKDAVYYDSAFTSKIPDWQEVSICLPVEDYDVKGASSVSYDMYLEDKEKPAVRIGASYDGRYEFSVELESLNKAFVSYSQSVADGVDSAETAEEIVKRLKKMEAACVAYTSNPQMGKQAKKDTEAKETAFRAIMEYDETIISIKSANNALDESLTALTGDLKSRVDEASRAAQTTMFLLILLVFLLGAGLVFSLTVLVVRNVNRSIRGFEGTLSDLSDGNMTVSASTDTEDEFGSFGSSLNQMTETLGGTLRSVTEVAGEVKESGQSLKDMAQTTNEISMQMNQTIGQIAEGANSQAKEVEETSHQMLHLGDLMRDMVESITQMDATAADMADAGKEATDIIRGLDQSNSMLTGGVDKIAVQIQKTNQSVEEIKDATNVIAAIASQTNLLSLNASIEAARAGEAGKGFAVVASEIQALADQSNQSAQAIDRVISALLEDFAGTMKVMDEVKGAAQVQNERLRSTEEKFAIVSGGIHESREKTMDMKEAIGECDKVQQAVSEIMGSLSALSEEYAASTAETAGAMQELGDTVQNVLAEAEKLMEMSGTLEESMGRFVL